MSAAVQSVVQVPVAAIEMSPSKERRQSVEKEVSIYLQNVHKKQMEAVSPPQATKKEYDWRLHQSISAGSKRHIGIRSPRVRIPALLPRIRSTFSFVWIRAWKHDF
jgi:hypothetical protein